MGRPNTMTGYIDGVTYNAAGQPTAITTSNPQVNAETRVYNALGQLTSLTSGALRFEYDFSATQNDGRITTQRTFSSGTQIESIGYSYDSLNRLSSATAVGQWSASYGYDGFGNLLSVTPTGSGPSSLSVTVSAATNRVSGWTYDSNGNVTAMPGFTGTYDIENRLKEATKNSTILYGYGADNRRIYESNRAVVNSGGDTINEYVTYWSGQRIGKYKLRWNSEAPNFGPPNSFVFAKVEENLYFGSLLSKTESAGV
jgi:YD repeat-containing protein